MRGVICFFAEFYPVRILGLLTNQETDCQKEKESLKYLISQSRKKHVSRHFGATESAGSRFRFDLFPTVDSVIEFLLDRQPINIIIQSNNTEANEFLIDEQSYIGWLGLGLISDYKSELIQTELRNGCETKFIEVGSLPKTNYITVVYKVENNKKKLITVFPGPYAPAFPHKKMTDEEYGNATQFWKDHILLKKI